MRKILMASLGIAFVGMVSPAHAASCTQHANNCMKNGGTRAVCYGAALAQCEKTGTYIGPYSGKAFSADSRRTGAAQACLENCRAKMRAQPGFFQNPANRRYCKDKCSVP